MRIGKHRLQRAIDKVEASRKQDLDQSDVEADAQRMMDSQEAKEPHSELLAAARDEIIDEMTLEQAKSVLSLFATKDEDLFDETVGEALS
jgi:hypothetical protein